LVIIRYDSDHDPNQEWVYNGADIDGSKVVWARDMGEAQNLELIRYFKNRKVWSVEPDLTPPKISAYPMTQDSATNNPAAHVIDGFDTVSHPSSSYAPEVR